MRPPIRLYGGGSCSCLSVDAVLLTRLHAAGACSCLSVDAVLLTRLYSHGCTPPALVHASLLARFYSHGSTHTATRRPFGESISVGLSIGSGSAISRFNRFAHMPRFNRVCSYAEIDIPSPLQRAFLCFYSGQSFTAGKGGCYNSRALARGSARFNGLW